MSILNNETFYLALGNTVDSIVITDMDSVIRYVNAAFTKITGYEAREAIGLKPNILKSEATTLQTYKEMWAIILNGGWWRGEILNKKKNGNLWYSFLSITQIRDDEGTPMGYIGIARDITEMKDLEKRLFEMSLEAIYMLAMAAEAKDDVTGSHLRRVRYYSEAIARQLGLSEPEIIEIGYSSMMHDVGKLNVPDDVLKKPGSLTEQEWEEMKTHPLKGAAILRDKPFFGVAREIAANHHERWDGSGYPKGKKGEEIPLSSRIVTLADVYDALTTVRPYKDAFSDKVAKQKILEGKGTFFDPQVVSAFEHLYECGVITKIKEKYSDEAQ
ncbi:MAG: PAS domain S-box protein [Candidatus Hydrogenedentes bacterium]|nr:PAS domain S-box protein [Candidatus Hydrogenedentota bacterium]